MSVIRNIGSAVINLTKVIKIRKGKGIIIRSPYIEFTTALTSNYTHNLFRGFDEYNRLYFNSQEECDKEYNEIVNILEDYYKKESK